MRAVAFSPAATLLAVASDDRTVALHDVRNGEMVRLLTGHEAWVTALAWNATGELLLTG